MTSGVMITVSRNEERTGMTNFINGTPLETWWNARSCGLKGVDAEKAETPVFVLIL
jgi:hypothetical protein